MTSCSRNSNRVKICNVARVSGYKNYILEWKFDFQVNAKILAMTDGLSSFRVGPCCPCDTLGCIVQFLALKAIMGPVEAEG